MTLKQFIVQNDNSNSVILLEGKRKVGIGDRDKLKELGRILALETENMIFRSGNADGADYYFSLGVAMVDKSRLQVITPYINHRKKANLAGETISVDEIKLNSESIRFSKTNKKTEKLIDYYMSGKRDRHAIKASYIIRDTIKVVGADDISPATFGIFYDDLLDPKSGGTGHTMNVCEQNKVPIIDQRDWIKWLDNKF